MRQEVSSNQIKTIQIDTYRGGTVLSGGLDEVWGFITKQKGKFEIRMNGAYFTINKGDDYFKSRSTSVFISNPYKRRLLFHGRCYETLRRFLDIVFYPHLYHEEIQKVSGRREFPVSVNLEYENKGGSHLYLSKGLFTGRS